MGVFVKIVVPYPISANAYWRTAVVKGQRLARDQSPYANTYVSEEARRYKRQVKIAAFEAGIREPLAGRVSLSLELYPHRPIDWEKRARRDPMNWDDDVRCIDLDNALKVLIDALKGVAYKDDAWVRRISADRMEPDQSGERAVVVVEPIRRESPQPPLFSSTGSAFRQVH